MIARDCLEAKEQFFLNTTTMLRKLVESWTKQSSMIGSCSCASMTPTGYVSKMIGHTGVIAMHIVSVAITAVIVAIAYNASR